jgi:glycosyltransferase involved in cell wall biosynthesis
LKADPARTSALSDTSVIAFGTDYWSDYRQTRRQILGALAARGWPITYTTGPHFVWDMAGPKWRNAPWRTGFARSDGVLLNRPGRMQVRWPRFGAWDEHVAAHYLALLQRQAGWRQAKARVAIAFHPSFVAYLERLGGCYVVYYADDNFSKMPQWTAEDAKLERRLVDCADLIVAITPGVARNLPGNGRHTARILPNGAEVELFVRGASDPCPADLAAIPRPRIGHVGSVNPKLDLRLIDVLAERRPRWQWVFIGQVVEAAIDADPASRDAWGRLKRRPNVHMLGLRPYGLLPAYEANMDVNALLNRTDPGGWWRDISPLKLHEYLAVGRPVVSTDIEALHDVQDSIAIARSPAEWISAIEYALCETDPTLVATRRNLARTHDWSIIAQRLDSWLMQLLATSPSSPD